MELMKKLKSTTSELHRRVEETPINKAIIQQGMKLEQYKELIQRNYLIHASLEHQIKSVLNKNKHASVSHFFHSKLEWLEKDMTSLGLTKPHVTNDAISIPRYHSIAELFGCLYVIEGSMLGGSILYRALRENKHLDSIPEFHFFKNYGKDVGLRWKTFKNIVEDENDDPDATIRAAKNTFRFYESVFQLNLG